MLLPLSSMLAFSGNPGALAAYDHVPADLPQDAPLVVVLHGCTQTAAAMEMSSGWDALADEHHFAVLYPEQSTSNNPVRCFNWAGEYGDTANLVRGMGENQSIISMIDAEIAMHGIDRDRVYIVGLSAGAAMTAVMLATWPDRFAGGAIMAGVPYRCGTTVNEAFTCQSPGVTKTAAQWGDLVRAASSETSFPRVQIWHGKSDTTVAPMNAEQLVAQWTNVHGTSATPDSTETIGRATRTTYGDSVELYMIDGMQHGIAIGADPGGACTASAGAFFLDVGICSTARAAAFFGLTGGGSGNGSGSGSSGGGDDDDGGGGGTPRDGGFGCSSSGGCASWLAMLAIVGLARRRRR